MSNKNLSQLYAEHAGKASDKWSLYLREYDRLFGEYRNKEICMLEIGIQNGGSLEIWSKYFPDAQTLIGCDINPDCARLSYEDPRIQVIVGDANAPDTRSRVLDRCSEFDIVIDDGSHLSRDIIKSFVLYFSRVKEGGVFIAEDLHCSYWGEFDGGLFDPYSSITFFKRLADIINYEHWGVSKARSDILRGIFSRYGCEIDEAVLAQVHSVEFINSMCVVRKAPASENGLGSRVVTGTKELVVQGNLELHGHTYQLDPIFNQSRNPWSAISNPPDEVPEGTLEELVQARDKVAELGQQLQQAQLELDFLRGSISWRMTAPIRYVMSTVRKLRLGSKDHQGNAPKTLADKD